jgi:RNA-directed DNA polymerase
VLRLADDLCIGGEGAADARKIRAVLPKRCARLGWPMHPEQTAVSACGKPDARQTSAKGNGTVDFLGLPHYWGPSRRGCWVSKRRTARKRLRRTKKTRWRWGRANRHAPVTYQYHMLCRQGGGPFRSYGMRGHYRLLEEVRRYARETWRYWLSRRRSKSPLSWEKFEKLLET